MRGRVNFPRRAPQLGTLILIKSQEKLIFRESKIETENTAKLVDLILTRKCVVIIKVSIQSRQPTARETITDLC